MPKAENFFTGDQKLKIKKAICNAECQTSGEIRIHIETKCNCDVLDRAAYIFAKLKMHKTKLRNGVLFYLAVDDKKFAILGDAGINAVVEKNFWDEVKDKMLVYFKEGHFSDGLIAGIAMAGEKLKKYFPYNLSEDKNELSDDVSFGK